VQAPFEPSRARRSISICAPTASATVVVTGVATSGCVESTGARRVLPRLLLRGRDRCGRRRSKTRHDASLSVMERAFAKLLPVSTIAESWRGSNAEAARLDPEAKRAVGDAARTALVLLNLQTDRAAELGDALPRLASLLARCARRQPAGAARAQPRRGADRLAGVARARRAGPSMARRSSPVSSRPDASWLSTSSAPAASLTAASASCCSPI